MTSEIQSKTFLTPDEQKQVEEAIAQAELKTSAEICLVIAKHCWGDIKDKAFRLFHKHGLDQTAERNAVMIMIVTTNRELLIFGDKGIHEKVSDHFWVDVKDAMVNHFKTGNHVQGIIQGVHEVADQLIEHFPRQSDDVNELSNEVIHED